jgi:carboxymethylenebutenolidase
MAALPRGGSQVTTWRDALPNGVEVILAVPDGIAHAGIVIPVDIFGLRLLFEEICDQIASHGFAVCAVEPFGRVEAAALDAMDRDARRIAVGQLRDDEQIGDLRAGADLLIGRFGVREVHGLGFCMGGYYLLKCAADGTFTRVVSAYGMIDTPEMWRNDGHRSPLLTVADACPTLAVFGGLDHWTPPEEIARLRQEWVGRDDCEVVVYPEADHGFVHAPDIPIHRPDDARDFWDRTLRFLGRDGLS